MELEGLSLCSHELATLSLSWARSVQSMLPLLHPISWRCIFILSFHLCLGKSGLSSSGLPTKTLYVPHLFLIHGYLPHSFRSSRFDHSSNSWWGVHHEAPYFAVYSNPPNPLLPCTLKAHISSSAPYLWPSACVPPWMWKTKTDSHIKKQTKLQFCSFYSSYFLIANWKTADSGQNGSKQSMSSGCL